MIFAYVHIVWFGVWILVNTGSLMETKPEDVLVEIDRLQQRMK
jgi:hypothetical protein